MKRVYTYLMILNVLIVFSNSLYAQVTQEWASRYNGPKNAGDHSTSIAVDSLGNVYVTGYSLGSGTDYDYATIKYDSSGTQQWVHRYNGPISGYDQVNSMTIDGSENVYVTGYSRGNGTDYDYATIKYTQINTGLYQTSYNVPENYSLSQNYPNPFASSTTISWQLPKRLM